MGVNSSADDPLLEFKIRDTGIGMTDEQIAMLYQPFVQADSSTTRKFGGTGLGLAISKRLAEMLGGDLTCESVPGEGTVFTLTIGIGNPETLKFHENPQDEFRQIPVIQQDPELPAGDSETRNLGPCTVLLAEDGVDNQRLISMLLKKEKAHVVLAENGDIAVRRALNAEQQGKPFDVILMDMSMPVLDGYGATRKLRELGIETPIIALTAHAMTGDRQKCIDAGCSDYATKPVNREKLRNIILKYRSRAQAEPVT